MHDPESTQRPLFCLIIIQSTILVFLGWSLSIFHALISALYLSLWLVSSVITFLLVRRKAPIRFHAPSACLRGLKRLRHPLVLCFSICALLVICGGLLYLPNNYDALSYRIPRVLNWAAHQGWFWIPTDNVRMNYSGAVQEWLFFPFLALLHTDMLLPLWNIIIFCSLPSLVFSILTRMQIAPRVAWWWMWIFPLGMGFVLQAGGAGNDILGIFFFLVAIDFALRFHRSRSEILLYCSILSIALCTGVKLSNVPLALPWVALLIPDMRNVIPMRHKLMLLGCIAVCVSFVPTIALNEKYTGDITGDPSNSEQLTLQNPAAGIFGNLILIGADNITPPFFPWARSVEQWANNLPIFRPNSWLTEQFPRFIISLNEMPQEEKSNLGLPLSILFVWSLLCATWSIGKYATISESDIRQRDLVLFYLFSGLAILLFWAKLGSESAARLFLPYSFLPLVFGLWLRDSSGLVGRITWRIASYVMGGIALVVLIFSPSRPLLPIQAMMPSLSNYVSVNLATRIQTVYDTYAYRADAFADVRSTLSSDDRLLGFVSSGDDLETSLWRPFGSRIVIHVLPDMEMDQLRQMGIHKVLVAQSAMPLQTNTSSTLVGKISKCAFLHSFSIRQFASKPPTEFILFDIDSCP
jgi:hypothetical protein